MAIKKVLGLMAATAMLVGVMAATAVTASAEEATADTAASSTWDEATNDSAVVGNDKTSPKTGAGAALAVILACGGFAGAGVGVKKLKK